MRVIRAVTLINGIDLQKAKYNISEIFIDLEKSEHNIGNKDNIIEDNNVIDKLEWNTDIAIAALTFQTFASDPALNSVFKTSTINSDLEKFCITYIASKSTQTVKWYKSMTPANDKLKEVYIDFWGPHDPSLRSSNIYATILMCKYTRKA